MRGSAPPGVIAVVLHRAEGRLQLIRVRVFMASSVDGYIAGPGDDLSFLPAPDVMDEGSEGLLSRFMEQVGAMLMGRRTYDIVQAMGVWPYGDTKTLIATTRKLVAVVPTISTRRGTIHELILQAKDMAGDGDVYLDGGTLINQLVAGLVDEMCLSIVPTVLGEGSPVREHGRERLDVDKRRK